MDDEDVAGNNTMASTDAFDPWQLRDYDDVPSWLQTNAFIRSGYRLNYSFAMCLRSVFMVHNETGNVWTHLVGLVLFLYLGWWVLTEVISLQPMETIVFVVFIAGNLTCMGCSTAYHLFSCHNERVRNTTMFLDYFGISALVVGSFFPPLWFVFACYPALKYTYMAMITVLGGIALAAPWFECFDSPEWYWRRLGVYVATVGSGVFPTVHSLVVFPLNHWTTPVFRGIGLMFLFYGGGVLIYVAKIPERWYPGHFDYWLHSHQIWHVMVLAAAVVHFFTCIGIYQRFSLDTACLDGPWW